MLIFREGTLADLPVISRLWENYIAYHQSIGLAFPIDQNSADIWASSFERTLGRFSFLWVVERDEQVLGFLAARIKRVPPYLGGVLVGEIADLWVEENARGYGSASKLCALALSKMRELQVHSIEVQVMDSNPGAQAFWRAQGFHVELVQFRAQLGGETSGHA